MPDASEPPGREHDLAEAVCDDDDLSYYPSIRPEDSGAEDVESLKPLPEGSAEVRLPSAERVRNPKCKTEDELPDEERQETKRQTFGANTLQAFPLWLRRY